jgi:hypothetical protein
MDMIGLDIHNQNLHGVLVGKRVQQAVQRTLHRLLQDIPSIHWTPHAMVGCLIHATCCVPSF